MKALRQIGALIRKDLGLQFRSKETLVLIFVFSVLVVLIFAFAFGPVFPEKEARGKLAGSVLWTAFVFCRNYYLESFIWRGTFPRCFTRYSAYGY